MFLSCDIGMIPAILEDKLFHLQEVDMFDRVNTPHNIIVYWLSNCEPDIVKYVVYRGESKDFSIENQEPLCEVDLSAKGLGAWYAFREYDHQMYPDKDVKPGRTYYYKVYAVDSAGQRSARSTCAHATTKHTSD